MASSPLEPTSSLGPTSSMESAESLEPGIIEARDWIESKLPDVLQEPTHSIAIICGSGLGGIADHMLMKKHQIAFDYADIPNCPKSTVPGHAGKLLFGLFDTRGEEESEDEEDSGSSSGFEHHWKVVLMVGRLHFYEGYTAEEVTFPIRLLASLGIRSLIATNAAGALNDRYKVGDIMVIGDHINFVGLAGNHPLRGENFGGPRFLALSDAYDHNTRSLAQSIWRHNQENAGAFSQTREMHEGVYAFVSGPSYETRAECRMLKILGADAVGMSTVPEVIAARHRGMTVLALSLITNKAITAADPWGGGARKELEEGGKANHEEVLQAAKEAQDDVAHFISCFIAEIC